MFGTEWPYLHTMLVNFVCAVFCGGIIGLERECKKKHAGLKTNLLICIGATIITTFSMMASREMGEQVRIVAQIVSGVGFLGAGAIIRSTDDRISGLTTAALIWVVAAIGIGIGMGHGLTCCVLAAAVVSIVHLVTFVERKYFRSNKSS